MKKIKIARIVTVPEAFVHIKPFLKILKEKNADVSLVSSKGDYEKVLKSELNIDIVPIEINRDIKLLKDLRALIALIFYFRRNKFDIIHSSTPKAGLLTALSGIFAFKSITLHTFTGQRWALLKGPKRTLLKFFDKLVIYLNTQCYADSHSQIQYLVDEGVAELNEIKCLHKGSYGGIDCGRFDNLKYPEARRQLLEEIKASDDSVVILYVGRLTRDKGVDDLICSFKAASSEDMRLKLVLVGVHNESLDILSEESLYEIRHNESIASLGFKSNPEKYFSGADFLCLPSYREGFGTVVIEAAACCLPTVGTKIPGLVDAILDGETGLLVELKNTVQLTQLILKLSKDSDLRKKLGNQAKIRAQKEFDSRLVSEIQWQEYQRLLKRNYE